MSAADRIEPLTGVLVYAAEATPAVAAEATLFPSWGYWLFMKGNSTFAGTAA